MNTWVSPVVEALSSGLDKLKQNIIEYLLPRLLKLGESVLGYMITTLSNHSGHNDKGSVDGRYCYGPMVMILRRARAMGLLTVVPSTAPEVTLQTDIVQGQGLKTECPSCVLEQHLDSEVLRTALSSQNEQVEL